MTDQKTDAAAAPKAKKSGIVETLKTVLIAGSVALVFRSALYEPFNIPSESMLPTLLVGDYLFVSKFTYGYSRHSILLSPPLWKGRIFERPVARGDVVVFKLPRDNSTDYIKRIVGLPGDRVQVIGGVLHLNGEAVKRERVQDFVDVDPYSKRLRRTAQYRETLPGGATFLTLDREPNGEFDNTRVFVVPAGHYFAMGDNRDNSVDSRADPSVGVGFVPAENLVGRADLFWFSTDGSASLFAPWTWISAMRPSRMFRSVGP
jgi:signal peptidase I